MYIGDGLLGDVAAHIEHDCPAPRYALIADSHVGPLYGESLREALGSSRAELVTFPAGEWNKTRDTWTILSDELLHLHFDRQSAIIGLGGGVSGDLAGFVAATFLRGIPHVQVPTTLLAMVDSAIGGKTGVDTAFGKNVIGAFHQPRAVFADVQTLTSLPPVQLAAGMAEAIKHGVIADGAYLDRMVSLPDAIRGRDTTALIDVVQRSVEIKAAVVSSDERERDQRSALNFGHTVAHALEALLGYELLHGEAVAIGMVAEATLGEDIGVTERGLAARVRDALEQFRLPVEPPGAIDRTQLIDRMTRDKKARDRTVRFALPATIGTMARDERGLHTIPVPESVIDLVLAHIW